MNEINTIEIIEPDGTGKVYRRTTPPLEYTHDPQTIEFQSDDGAEITAQARLLHWYELPWHWLTEFIYQLRNA